MRLLWPAVLLLGLFSAAHCVAAATQNFTRPDQPRPLRDYFRESWSSRDGLPHNLINDIAQSAEGYLWFATWEGAVRYNGREFVVFDRERVPALKDHGFRAIHVGASGVLWLGSSRGGVAKLEQGRWSVLSTQDGLAQDEIMDVLEARDGSLWIAFESAGVDWRRPNGEIVHFDTDNGLPSNVTYALAEDPDGAIWVGTSGGLARIDELGARRFGVERGLGDTVVFSVHVDARDRLLVGGEKGVFEFDGQRFQELAAELPSDPIQRVLRDRTGRIWAGTVNRGVIRISADVVETLGVDLGLPNARVAAIFEDGEASMWLGTNGGLFRLRDAPFTSLLSDHGLPDDYVRTVLEDRQGTLWIGTSSGLARLHQGEVERIGDADQSILSLAESADGSMWIGSYASGLLRLKDETLQPVSDTAHGLAGNQVRALLEARDGSLWVGTNRGLSKLTSSGIRNFGVKDGLPREFIIALHEDKQGVIWIGTANGLARLDDDGQGVSRVRLIGDAQDVFGFAELEDGTLWLATDRGIARLRDDTLSRLGYAQGLPLETIFQIVPDRIGNLWLSSNRGVLRIDLAQANAAADGRLAKLHVEVFGELDGMASAQCNGGSGPAAVRRADGSVWIATARGVASIQPSRLAEFQRHSPSVVIEDLLVDDEPAPLSPKLELTPGTRRLEFHYAGLSYLLPQKIRYRYWLEGFDEDWVERGNVRTAQFTNLGPGEYRFRVAAANSNGDWSADEAVLAFSIPPFFWQRTDFQLLCAALLLCAAFAAYRLRVSQIRRNERVLRELVDSRTVDLREQTERLLQADQEKTELLDKLRTQSEAFERQAREDALTGIANRRAFDEVLMREFARARRHGGPLCLIMLDIDWFKRINDSYSHSAGDEALRAVAAVLRRESREIDAIARYGGEEFIILCSNTELESALCYAERVRRAVHAIDCSAFAPGLRLSISLGVAEATGLSHHERLISRADEALYRAKQGGRNRVCH